MNAVGYLHINNDKNKQIGYVNEETGELFTLAGNAANPLVHSRNGTIRRSKKYAMMREAVNGMGIAQNEKNLVWETNILASAPRSKSERQAALRSLFASASETIDDESATKLKSQLQDILK
jgi:hypothetical protein